MTHVGRFLLPLLFCAIQGCCGLAEETEQGARRWVDAEIPVGSTQLVAEQSLRRHCFLPTIDPKGSSVSASRRVGSCLGTLSDDWIGITVELDSRGRVVRTYVNSWIEGL